MALPAGVTTCVVTKKAPVSFSGGPAKVLLDITPSVRLVHTATGIPLADFIESSAPAEGSAASVTLPHTDQAGFQDAAGNAYTGWHYTARVREEKTGRQPKTLPLFDFQVLTGQAEVDLSLIPHGVAVAATSAPIATVTSINGATGSVNTNLQAARTPEDYLTGVRTLTDGAVTSAAFLWPDGITGTFTGTPSVAFPGSLDSYTITHGTTTYTQPAVTRDASGTITNQPAIVLS